MFNKIKIGLGALCLSGSLLFGAPLNVDACSEIQINATNFPDASFRKTVSEEADSNKDGKLSRDEQLAVKQLYLNPNVTSLKGTEYFTNLETLFARHSKITTVDVRKNKKLTYLDVKGCEKLTSITLGCQKNLENLQCDNCSLTSLDVTGCPELNTLFCYANQIKSLDLSRNKKLSILRCMGNQLDSLSLRNNKELTMLWCDDNNIKTLDLGSAPALLKTFASGKKVEGGKYTTYQFDGTNNLMMDKNVTVTANRNTWFHVGSKWYYFGTDGSEAKGWKQVDGKWYYFKKDGLMATREWIGGYWLEKDGSWDGKKAASWKKTAKGWMYKTAGGKCIKNSKATIDGKKYSFDKKGYMK